MNDMQKVYNYYYRFKTTYYKKIKEEYTSCDDKLYYENIKNKDEVYSSFIKKIMCLFDRSDIKTEEIVNIKKLLESEYLLDRLKGLKDSKQFIKLEGEPI